MHRNLIEIALTQSWIIFALSETLQTVPVHSQSLTKCHFLFKKIEHRQKKIQQSRSSTKNVLRHYRRVASPENDNLARRDVVSLWSNWWWWENALSFCSRGSKRWPVIGRERRPGARREGEGASRAGSERAGRIEAAVSSRADCPRQVDHCRELWLCGDARDHWFSGAVFYRV